jgi:ataxia telangiectasia mutated family protein
MIGWLEAVRVGPRQIQRQVLNIMEMSNIMFRFFSAGLDASKVNSKYILDQSLRDILKVDSWLPLENNDSYKQLPPEYSTYLTELYESSSFGSIHESSAPPELKIPIIDADAMQILNSYANIFLNQNFVFEEKADGVSNGMLTALGLLIVLCVAIERSETDSSGSSRVSYAVDSCVCCWRLICAILEECCRKYNASLIKDIDIIDICSVLLQIAPRLVRIERAQNDVANPRMSCVDAMCKLLINVHASGCSKQRAFTSGRGVSGDIVDDMDMIDGFDQENISRQAMSPHVQSVSANNDELWGDDELDPAPTGLGLSSRVSAARSPSSGAKNLPSLRLSPEGMHLFTTITRLMVLCSTLHASHVVAFAVAVLQHGVNVTESVEAFDPSHFHAAPPSISVKSEFELALAQGVADVAPCDVIFGLLLSAWDKEWSGLGYARVLCIVKDLLRASSNLSSSGVLNITFIPKCGDIITGGYKNTGDFLSHLWYIRVCQLIVARELLRMDASAHKEIFASMVLKGLTDIDSRVRYVAGRNLSLIFATFTRNPPAIYRSMVGGLHDWVIAALDDAAAAQLRQYAMSRLLSVVAALSLIAKECDSMAAFVLRDILFLRASCRVYIDSQKDLCSALDNSIFKALRFISSVRNYGSVKYLVQDNLTYILQQWISGKSDQILLQSPYPLKLFPLAIVGINSDFKAALPMIASYLIPAVCIADASEKRWMLLSELCQDADIASNDANIAKLLLDNMVAILALDAMRAAMKSQHPNNSVSDDYARNFILRIVDTSELKRREKNHVRLVIRDIFLMPTSWNIKGLDDGSANDTSVEDIIWRALRSCTKSIDSTSSKSHQQNAHTAKLLRTGGIGQHLFEIVSILISRAKDTRLIWVVDGICAAASVLMDVFLPISLSSTNPVSGLADGMQHASILFVLCQELLGNPSVVPRYSALILLEKHVKHMVDLSDVLQSCSIETNDPLVDCFRSLIDDIYCCVYALRNFICLASDDEYLSGTFGNIRLKASDINAETELLGALFPISCSLVAKFAVPSRWNIASLDISNDDSQISKCLSMLVKMTSQYCESILWGFPYSRTTIRMLLCQLNSALSICSASHETYSKFGLMLASHEVDEEERRSLASDAWGLVPRELLASLVACVISLISKFHNNHTPEHKAILRLTHILLGKIGSPNARKVSHNDTRVKFDIFGPDGYDAYAASHLKLRFIYSLLTSSLLSNMESAKKALVILLRLFRSNCLAGAISENLGFTSCVYYRRFQLDKIFGKEPYDIGSESLHPLLKMIQLPFPKVKSSLIEYVWDPRGKSFESWLPFFMIVLLNNMSSRGSPYSIASPELEFFTTVAPVFPEFSNATELLLPVLLEALIEHSPSESIRSTLSQNFEACFLILNWDVSQSINKLGCKFLWYIFQKKKREFLQHPTLPASGRGRKRKAGADDGDMTGSVSARYGYVLKIDPFRIASVSASCGFLGMANAFIEYFTISEDSDRYANKNISSLLVKLSSDLHDNDFIFGIPQTESSLDVEGLIFSHSGKWREALSTYESALSAQRTSTNTASSNSSNLVTDALKGLGFNHVLSSYRRTTDLDDISRSASDSVSKYRNDLSSWDAFDHVVSSIDKQPSTSLLRVRESTEILSKRLSVHDDEDTFARVTPLMLNIQQLYEVEEALSIINCSQTSSLVRPGVASVFERWRNRMEATQGSSSLGIDVLSARLRFVDRMMRSHVLKPVEALACFQQFQQLATTSDMVHSFSPLLFSFISNLDRSSIVSNDSIEIILKRLVQIESKLCESIFLWNKSLGDMALSALKGNVIQPIRESLSALLTEIQTSSKGRTSGSASLIQQQQSLVVRLRHNLSISYLLGGQWLAAKKNIPGMAVINDYMQLAVDFAEEHHQKMLALKTLGHYNHKLYVNIRNRMASPEWIQGMQLALDRQQELDRCKTQARALQAITKRSATEEQEFRNMLKHLRVLQKEIEIDVAEKQVAESSAHQHLLQAITNFGSVLSESSSSDVDIVFLLISLWFENQTNTEVNRYVGGIVDSTKSFKFVSLSYQILSRISAEGLPDGSSSRNRAAMPESESFSSNIVRLASKLCIDHPYHIIPQLLALANEDYIPLQKTPSNASSRSSLWKGLSSSDPSSNQRIIAAKTILSQSGKLTSRSKINFKSIVDSLNALTEDYICLAFASTDQFIKSNRFSGIPLIELGSVFPRFTSLGSDHLCPVISKTINIRSDADYSDVVKLVKFLPNFSITESGITRPKIISCVGSDGVVYKQLVKGNDDLRQDAVMEQVFEHVNIMFQRSDVTNSKDLRIRTYKVVPMTRQCGVVEWVNNTIPFGSYLIDKITGAHARYYPDDLGHAECRRIMQGDVSSDDAAAGAKTKEDLFTYVCSKFHPVFRYFFLERYNDPAQWLGRRVTYTRSVAAVSMIGYVLGIGDRHSHNILVDTATAEVVHIDFGIMFEQGKVLGCPETVPFRLTRDVVDGMGITGVEGSFRRCCEASLQVLRDNQQRILTILEVVIHDPLYKWTLSPKIAKQRQRTEHDEGNFRVSLRAAEPAESSVQSSSRDAGQRTLLRVRNKLQGHDDPCGDTFTVQGQVEYLLQEAQSVSNLSKLFPGWAPWL